MPNIFRREEEYWTIVYAGHLRRFKNRRGFELLAHLLRQPGVPMAALDLARRGCGRIPVADSPADSERARINVTRAIKEAVNRINTYHPPLGAHFQVTVRTGNSCVYRPDPRLPIEWEVEGLDTEQAPYTARQQEEEKDREEGIDAV